MAVKFFETLSSLTGGEQYISLVILSLHFVSRERFFYYLTVTWLQSFMTSVFKFCFVRPRPVWVFDGLSDTGCSSSFGNPSGHAFQSADMVLFIILDHFFASQWSRDNLPDLNTKSLKQNPIKFTICVVLALIYWPLVVFDRIFLGKHTFNQVFLGS